VSQGGFYHRNEHFSQFVDVLLSDVQAAAAPALPRNLRLVVGSALLPALTCDCARCTPAGGARTGPACRPASGPVARPEGGLQQPGGAAAVECGLEPGTGGGAAGGLERAGAETGGGSAEGAETGAGRQAGEAEKEEEVVPGFATGQSGCCAGRRAEREAAACRALGWEEVFRASMKAAEGLEWTHKGLSPSHGLPAEGGPQSSARGDDDADEGFHEGDCWQCDGGGGPDGDAGAYEGRCGETVTDVAEARSIMRECGIVVGMHPDQVGGGCEQSTHSPVHACI
jgi:hypothetical protein